MKNSLCHLSVVILFATASLSEDFPTLKAGLWKSIDTKGNESSICYDQDTMKKSIASADAMTQAMGSCSRVPMVKLGNAYVTSATCNMLGQQSTIKTELIPKGAVEYTTIVSQATQGQTKQLLSATSTYVGACPEGMKAGDMKMKDGQMMNIDDMMQQVKQMQEQFKNIKLPPGMQQP